jgi:hypothetical protein
VKNLRRLGICGAFSIALTFVLSPARWVNAANFNWNVANGDFNTGTNWDPNGPPGMFDGAFINNGGTSTISSGVLDVDSLNVGSAAGTSGTFNMTGGDLLSNSVHFGDAGNATVSINNAILRAGNGSLFIGGDSNGGTGAMTIAGSTSLVTSGDDIGIGRTGNGTLNFQGGRMTGVFTFLGKFGTGVWNHSGGVFDQAGGDIEIGDGGRPDQAGTPGPRNGTINLSAGVIHGAGHFALGNRNGTGTVNINGGALDITGDSNGTGTIFVGRGMDWAGMTGAGGPVALRVTGDDSIVVANGGFSMNVDNVASSSTLIANITGPAHTPIKVVGDANIAKGTFKVELTGYTPVSGDTWTIVEAGADISTQLTAIDALVSAGGYPMLTHVPGSSVGTLMGTFASTDFSMAPLTAGLSWGVDYVGNKVLLKVTGTAVGISGDYNNNGVVDAADYVVWRNAGPTDVLPNDPSPGVVDANDYNTWKSHFGMGSSGSGAAASLASAAVPEPGCWLLVATALATMGARYRHRCIK